MFKCISSLFRSGGKGAQTKPKETESPIKQEPVITERDDSRPPPYPHEQAFTPGINALWSPLESQMSKIDIVLVPDLGTVPAMAWTLLPSEMPTARILAFSYAQNTADRNTVSLEKFIADLAVNLLDCLSSYREKDCTNERPIAFISHGLGGLVCKDALLSSSAQLKPPLCNISIYTCGIIFLGTPFNGTGLASWLQSAHDYIGLSKQESLDHVDFVRDSSDQIFDRISTQWKRIINEPRRGLSRIEATYLYKESPSDADFFTQKDLAALLGCSLIEIPCNSGDMSKITNAGEPLFQAISEKLHHWAADTGTNARHQRSPSPAQPPLNIATQVGDHNRQYNMFGKGKQRIVGGSYFEAPRGDQNFILSYK